MRNLGDSIYFIIAIAIFIASLVKKANQKKNSGPKPILGEVFPVNKMNKPEPEVSKESDFSGRIKKEIKYEREYISYENTEPAIIIEPMETVKYSSSQAAPVHEIMEKFELPAAVVFSEILERKYF
jgi:hypothetical protein